MITVGVIRVGSRLGSGMGAGQMSSIVIIPGGGRIRIPRVANVHVTDFRQLPAHNTRTRPRPVTYCLACARPSSRCGVRLSVIATCSSSSISSIRLPVVP